MDEAYSRHAPHSRRSNLSSPNLSSLAPHTPKFPLHDIHNLPADLALPYPDAHIRTSYLEGKSAPSTPSILSPSSSRLNLSSQNPRRHHHRTATVGFPKSKSSAHIPSSSRPRSGTTTPGGILRRSTSPRRLEQVDASVSFAGLTPKDRSDSDWLLRTSALLSTSSRESKGQSWLLARSSSTSLTNINTAADEEEQAAIAREIESIRNSRRGSVADDELSPIAHRSSFGPGSKGGSLYGSRYGSRQGSRRGSRVHLMQTPLEDMSEHDRMDYFNIPEEYAAEPDFVDIREEEMLEEESGRNDEALVRKLAKKGGFGLGGVMEKLLGWSLFALDEADEDGEENEGDGETETETGNTSDASVTTQTTLKSKSLDAKRDADFEEPVPPPGEKSEGWQDAAWLLSVAVRSFTT